MTIAHMPEAFFEQSLNRYYVDLPTWVDGNGWSVLLVGGPFQGLWTPDFDNDQFLSDIPVGAWVNDAFPVVQAGWGTLTGLSRDDRGRHFADPIQIVVTSGSLPDPEGAIIFNWTGDLATSPMLCMLTAFRTQVVSPDYPASVNSLTPMIGFGQDWIITWAETGIFEL
jgi:hypothetical protein